MAERKDIDFSYTLTDRVIRLSLGELADFSGAKYDGDFALTLEQAQRRKHEIYRRLFAQVADVLPEKGRFYLQTMVFGRNMIPVDEIDRSAPRDSDAWYLAMMGAAFPGSFLPFGSEQVVRCAEPHFRLVSSQSGRLDYIETIRQWDKRTEAWNPRLAMLKL